MRTDIPSKAALASHLPSPWRKHAFNGDCSMTPVTAQVGRGLLPEDELAQSD